MQYLSLEIRILRTDAAFTATNAQIGVWIRLLAYCADHENGGVIRDGFKWTDRQCLPLGFLRSDLDEPCAMWRFDTGHLYVTGYSQRMERAVAAKRKGGKIGSSRRWDKKVVEMPTRYQAGSE